MVRQNPCRDCENRSAGCHATCEHYITWKQEYNELQAKIRAEKELKWRVDEAREASVRRQIKKTHRR